MERCDGCRFWDRSSNGNIGEDDSSYGDYGACCRHPPQLSDGYNRLRILETFWADYEEEAKDYTRGVWPETLAENWCGEWQPPRPAEG